MSTALYFLLAGMSRFIHLKVGLAAVLVFVGAKLLASDIYHVPIWLSLAVIATLIGGSVVTSLVKSGGQYDAVPR